MHAVAPHAAVSGMTVRARILVLVLVVAVFAVGAAGWIVTSTYLREQQAIRHRLGETARALSLVVDRALGQREAVAWTLGTSPSIAARDWAAFDAQARRATAGIGGWAVLFGTDGMVVNTSQPPGTPLPRRPPGTPPYVNTTASGATVSGLFKGPASGQWIVAVSVPVQQPGFEGGGLSVVVPPERMQRVIEQQQLPAGWIASIIDGQGQVVARQPDPRRWVGTAVRKDLFERIRSGGEGFERTRSLDGKPVTAFFSSSPGYGWTFVISVPNELLDGGARATALRAALVALVLLGGSGAAAAWVGGRIAAPARRLHAAAQALDAGRSVAYHPGGVVELDAAGATLVDAGTRLLAAKRELEQREQRLSAQLARMQLLDEITRAIGARLDLDSVFRVVCSSIEQQLRAFCVVALLDGESGRLRGAGFGASSHQRAVAIGLADDGLDVEGDGLVRCLDGLLVHEPVLDALPQALPRRMAAAGLHSAVFAPLQIEGRPFGLIVVAREAPHAFSSGDCEFLRQLSDHVALAARQARLHGDLKRAYDDLRHTQQSALQHERLRALGQMASGIAHDINNAVSPIALYTESLLAHEPGLSATAREQLETIQRAIDDVAQTVARMREFYRPAQPQVALAHVDLNPLVRHVIDLTRARWRDMAHQAGIEIAVRTELDDALPPVMGAEGEIREALTNLVFNAADALPRGGTIVLRTRAAGGAVVVEVADDGVGMDEPTRRRCLEPFFTTKGERGTGLGLAMVYGAAQRHGAQVEIESAPGRGTTVRLVFPPAQAREGTTSRWGQLEVEPPERPLHVLVVDDDPVLTRSLAASLQAEGHRVKTAAGGQDGIDAFQGALAYGGMAFDVVITDLGMPGVDGRRVAQAVKALAPNTPVVMLTGWGRRMADDGEQPPHVDHLLSKPPRLAELREVLSSCARRTQGRDPWR
jgi:signal transduction histidine kinase/CheY-like chemotaxis protein